MEKTKKKVKEEERVGGDRAWSLPSEFEHYCVNLFICCCCCCCCF